MNRRHFSRRAPWSAAVLLLLMALLVQPASAQVPQRYFSQTGHYLRGAFRSFWEQNGGVRIFGYPITEEFTRRSDNKITQYFERARFELTVQNNQAIVELGRLGVEFTGIQQPVNSLGGAFRTFWQRNGGAPIFGQPLTSEYTEVLSDGRRHTVQWFERSKFELWNDGVRLTLLGSLFAPQQLRAPWPANVAPGAPLSEDGTPAPPGGSTPGQPATPGTPGVRVAPGGGNPGQVFTIQGEGFQAGEGVSLWLTAPDASVRPIDARPTADNAGSITSANLRFSSSGFVGGRWAISAQGLSSGRKAVGTFTITGPVGDPNRLGIILQTSLVPAGPGSISPLAAVPGAGFTFNASGYDPNERVGVWLTRPNGGGLEAIDERLVQYDGRGGIRVVFVPQSGAEGVWTITGQGVNTKRSVTVPYKVTRDYFAPLGTARPASRNGAVTPAEGGRGTQFRLTGTGFRANETLDYWVTSPDGSYYVFAQVKADSRGRIGFNPGQVVQFGAQNPAGVYGYHYRGTASGNRVDLYMTFTGAP
jgi:hypothetical protein